MLKSPQARDSIIRFNAVAASTLVYPLPAFVSENNPAKYTPVTMKEHMETTVENLERGLGSWCETTNTSKSASYEYSHPLAADAMSMDHVCVCVTDVQKSIDGTLPC